MGDLDCNRPGDLSLAAETMEDIATLIDEVGLEDLQEQLGVDLSFSLKSEDNNWSHYPVYLCLISY